MPRVLLFEDAFEGEVGVVNLSTRGWEYIGAANRYRAHPEGYADGNGTSVSVARKPDLVAPGGIFVVAADIFREGVDFVGGEVDLYGYAKGGAIAGWDFLDSLRVPIERHSLSTVSLAAIWQKAAGAPAPASVLLAFSGEIAMGPNAAHRFLFRVDEPAARVDIMLAEAGTGANEVVLDSGPLPPELAAHLAADRHTAIAMARAAFGLVGFRCYYFGVFSETVAPVTTGAPCKVLLRVYGDDRTTVLWEVSTDPAHANPYLKEPDSYGEQELDVAHGSASLATVRVQVVDKAMIPGNQSSGFLTGKLATLQVPDIGGHRCELIRFDPDGQPVVIIDGPASQPALSGWATYEWQIADTRETEAAVRCFDSVGPSAPVVTDEVDTTPTETGTAFGFTWGTEYP